MPATKVMATQEQVRQGALETTGMGGGCCRDQMYVFLPSAPTSFSKPLWSFMYILR